MYACIQACIRVYTAIAILRVSNLFDQYQHYRQNLNTATLWRHWQIQHQTDTVLDQLIILFSKIFPFTACMEIWSELRRWQSGCQEIPCGLDVAKYLSCSEIQQPEIHSQVVYCVSINAHSLENTTTNAVISSSGDNVTRIRDLVATLK